METANGRDWVYVGTDNTPKAAWDFHTVTRFPVDAPAERQLVWNKTLVSGDTFQVSGDGRTAGGLFPWPKAGIASLPNGDLKIVGDGCWTAFRDAGVGLFWYLRWLASQRDHDGSFGQSTVDRAAQPRARLRES